MLCYFVICSNFYACSCESYMIMSLPSFRFRPLSVQANLRSTNPWSLCEFYVAKGKARGRNSIQKYKAGPILSMISLQHICNVMIWAFVLEITNVVSHLILEDQSIVLYIV